MEEEGEPIMAWRKGYLHIVIGIGPVKTDSNLEKRRIKILSQESGRQNIEHSVENGVPEPAEELICRVSDLQGTSRGQWDQGHKGVYQHQSVSTFCIQTSSSHPQHELAKQSWWKLRDRQFQMLAV